MSYQILGRAIKNEHISLGVLLTAFGGGYLMSRGGSSKPAPTTVQQAKESVPISAGSTDEEQFIQKFIAEAEREGSGTAAKH